MPPICLNNRVQYVKQQASKSRIQAGTVYMSQMYTCDNAS